MPATSLGFLEIFVALDAFRVGCGVALLGDPVGVLLIDIGFPFRRNTARYRAPLSGFRQRQMIVWTQTRGQVISADEQVTVVAVLRSLGTVWSLHRSVQKGAVESSRHLVPHKRAA